MREGKTPWLPFPSLLGAGGSWRSPFHGSNKRDISSTSLLQLHMDPCTALRDWGMGLGCPVPTPGSTRGWEHRFWMTAGPVGVPPPVLTSSVT